MNVLVIGLGSMGKRRIRCLQSLGEHTIAGFDPRADRRQETEERYGIKTYADITQALRVTKQDALIISVPPDYHHEYIELAIRENINFFVEASVVDTNMEEIKAKLAETNIIAAPSATLLFHPAIQIIADIVQSGSLGKLSNVILHSGQYLPDWHPYEQVSEYYVSNPATGGGREIVPFELTWFTKVFGFPQRVCGNYRKTITIEGAEAIDDTYNCLLDYQEFLASITVDVVSRHAVRRLLINGAKQQLVWDWDVNCVKVFDGATGQWNEISYEMKSAATGYNQNIGENMYIEEVRNFINAIAGREPFANDMDNDHKVLKLLYSIEQSDKTSHYVRIDQ